MIHLPKYVSRTLRRFLNPPILALAVVVVLTDDAFRAFVVPAVRALARLELVRRLEAVIARMPPHTILLLFLVPLAIIEPLKVYGLYLFGQGRFTAGVLTFVLAKVVGLGLAERLFAIGRDKLLSIGWFAWCYARIIAIRDAVHAWLVKTRVWQQALQVVRAVRNALAQARARVAGLLSGKGRFAAARRRIRRRWTA